MGDSTAWSSNIDVMVKLDNYIYIGGYSYSSYLTYRTYLAKLDEFGNKVNDLIIGCDSVIYYPGVGNSMIVDDDSNVVLVGQTFYKQWNGFVVKLNKNLDTLWNKKYTFPDSLINYACDTPRHVFKAIEKTPDGNYIIMGSYFKNCNYTHNNESPYLIKLDKNGNILWRKLYPNLLSSSDIAATSDSGFVFSAVSYGINITKIDSLGSIKWSVTPNNTLKFLSTDIVCTGNTTIAVVPYKYYGTDVYSNKFGLDVTKVNSLTGQIIWNKQYIPMSTVRCPTLHQHIEVEVDANDNIIIAGTGYVLNYDTTAGAYRGFLMKLNSNGDSLWTHYYDWGDFFQRDSQFNDFVITDDGGILAGGFWNPPHLNYKQGAWLVKTDSMGNAPGVFTVGIKENVLVITKHNVNVYPNPATDNFNLRFEQSPKANMQLSIYSTTGTLVKQQQITAFSNEYRVDIRELKSGVYFIRLESDGEVVYSGKFIKQ